jgi:hypothetical protein
MALSRWNRLISKQVAFLLFNVVSVISLWASGFIPWTAVGVFSGIAAMILMNYSAYLSTKDFPEWKWTYKQQRDWETKGNSPVNQSTPESGD